MSGQAMNIIAVILGPIVAVLITLLYQRRRQNQDIKHRLFLTLMTHRKANPPSPQAVEALNTIDVVFHDRPSILKLWHEYFESLCQPNHTPPMAELSKKKYLDLLYEIGRTLKYKNLHQTDIDIFYSPQGMIAQSILQGQLQTELLRVLSNSDSFSTPKKN